MQFAPYLSEQTTVHVIGNQPETALPSEFDFMAQTPLHENRYRDSEMMRHNGTIYGDSEYSQQYNTKGYAKWYRARAIHFIQQWDLKGACPDEPTGALDTIRWETSTAAEKHPALDYTITPMLGIAATAWESIDVTLGLNDLRLVAQTKDCDHVFWMSFLSETNKNPISLKWLYEPAGFFDVHSLNYGSGIAGMKIATQTYDPDSFFKYDSQNHQTVTPVAQVTNFLRGTTPQGKYDIQDGEWCGFDPSLMEGSGGFWFDKEMRRWKRMTVPNRATKRFWTCLNAAIISPFFNNILNLPPMEYNYTFVWGTDAKPRFYETPKIETEVVAANTTTVTKGRVGDDFNIFPNRANSYMIVNAIELRPDLGQALIDSWTLANAAISFYARSFQHYSTLSLPNISGVSQLTLMPNYSNLPYKSVEVCQPELPITGLHPRWKSPQRKNFPSFAYGDPFWKSESWTLTQPINKTSTRNQPIPLPKSLDPLSQSLMETRGMLIPEHYIQEIMFRAGPFLNPEFNECDSYSFQDLHDRFYMPPMGFAIHDNNVVTDAAGAGQVELFGSQSVTFPNGSVLNTGPSNLINNWFHAAAGFDDPAYDYGIYKGALIHEFMFHNSIPTSQRQRFLWMYFRVIELIGNNSASSDFMIS